MVLQGSDLGHAYTFEGKSCHTGIGHVCFEKGDNIDRATRYIYVAMEDAQFFGDRLRILEIAHKFPTILSAYTEKIQGQKSRISFGLVLLAILSIIVLLSLISSKSKTTCSAYTSCGWKG